MSNVPRCDESRPDEALEGGAVSRGSPGSPASAFARRFTLGAGVPPLKWLAEHRLELAQGAPGRNELAPRSHCVTKSVRVREFLAKPSKRRFGSASGVFRRSPSGAPPFRVAA